MTTIHALDGGRRNPGATAFLLKIKDDLPLKIVPYNQSMEIKETLDLGLPRIGGCICADGAFESHTAALFEPYADEPDNYGTLTYTQEEMSDFILRAHQAGLQIAIHCEADRAIEQVLYAYERALRHFPRKDHRHRIEHFEIPNREPDRKSGQGWHPGRPCSLLFSLLSFSETVWKDTNASWAGQG